MYVQEIEIIVDGVDGNPEWAKKTLLRAQQFAARDEAKRRSVKSILLRTFGLLGIGRGNLRASEPFVLPEHTTLANLHTVHIDYPILNAQILAAVSPPALDTLHLTLRDSDSGALQKTLRPVAARLRVLVLLYYFDRVFSTVSFPKDSGTARPEAPLLTNLRVLRLCSPLPTPALLSIATHLLAFVLAVPELEKLVIEPEGKGAIVYDEERAALERVLLGVPSLKALHPRVIPGAPILYRPKFRIS
ncbi:hypothetical protein DFH06DRAFT_1428254 [Mycena polygramma]|nr:hypothetical protein DFH06DRAFT_1428254 [Mycena polygramma]